MPYMLDIKDILRFDQSFKRYSNSNDLVENERLKTWGEIYDNDNK